jgi:ABC-type xylose transport system permease subunit
MSREEELLQKLVDMEVEKKRTRLAKEERRVKLKTLLIRLFIIWIVFEILSYVLFQLAVSYNFINF